MDTSLPGILLTGASGFVGRNFIKAASGRFRLFCLARRSMEEAGVHQEENLRWIQVDIANREKVLELAQRIQDYGGVEYTVNLAGYYNFTNQEHPEYFRTNIKGTENMLELSQTLLVKRFVFASSQAVCAFGTLVDEDAPPNADMPYARSKRAGEELVKKFSLSFPCTIVRIAAVYSDWCEYPPLYTMLNNWCSGKFFESRILAGKGKSALPYIHVEDLAQFFLRVIEKNADLPSLHTVNAGPDGAVTHLELFRIASQFFYNRTIRPLFVSPSLLLPAIYVRQAICHLLGTEAFEQPWMIKYVDEQLVADSRKTRELLGWRPTPRKTITRRLVFLIENMKRNPDLWRNWNEAMINKAPHRPNLEVHELLCNQLTEERESLVGVIADLLLTTDQLDGQPLPCHELAQMHKEVVIAYVRLLYQLIITIIRTVNRPMMQQYAHTIAFLPMTLGFCNGIASHCLFEIGEFLVKRYRSQAQFTQLTAAADQYIAMTLHMAVDRIEDQSELAKRQSPGLLDQLRKAPPPQDPSRLDQVVAQLVELCNEAVSGKSWSNPLNRDEEQLRIW